MKRILTLIIMLCCFAVAADQIKPDPKLTPGAYLTNTPIATVLQVGYTAGYWRIPPGMDAEQAIAAGKATWVAKRQHKAGDVPVRHTPASSHRTVFARYGLIGAYNDPRQRPGYEDDHFWSLEIGGSNAIENRWPESYLTPTWNAHTKDRLENKMRDLLRAKLAAQGPAAAEELRLKFYGELSADWTAAYRKYVGK